MAKPAKKISQNPPPEPIADSVDGARVRLNIGRTKIYEEINNGRLRSVKAGKRRLIPRDAQAEWLANLPAA